MNLKLKTNKIISNLKHSKAPIFRVVKQNKQKMHKALNKKIINN